MVGESLTDIIRTAAGTREHPGGSPANVALGLARLGTPTAFLTALGPDPRGEAIAARLAASGVEVLPESFCLPVTSSAAAVIADDGAASYEFDLAWELPGEVALPPARHVHVGSVAAFLAPGAERVEEIVRAARRGPGTGGPGAGGSGSTVSFDPNIRPALVGPHAEALTRFERLAGLADVVKLSDEDAAYLCPGLAPRDAARRIADRGPAVVAVTLGASGSLLLSGGHEVEVPPVPVAVRDTVGAGDSYMSALVHALLAAGRDRLAPIGALSAHALADAGRFAARAAAVTVSRAGAEPPRLTEVPAVEPAAAPQPAAHPTDHEEKP
ncbi:carbohydrate kinase [Sinomonas halotolerans]